VLGVEPDATWTEVTLARRRLAKELHPDLHQGPARAEAEQRMTTVNRAFDDLRAARDRTPASAETTSPDEAYAAFSVDALPVVAFEAVLMAAVELGDVVHMDEPYVMGVLVDHPGPCQCLIELAPEAGGTVVTFDVAPRTYGECPPGTAVRDAFADEVQRQAGLAD